MAKYNQLVFLDGKEKALDALFVGGVGGSSNPAVFGYLAIGYNEDITGFEDPANDEVEEDSPSNYGGFKEIKGAKGYTERIPLSPSSIPPTKDIETGQIIKKYEAELPANVITNQLINQFAICDNKDIDGPTQFYSAATFNQFLKTDSTSITFIIGFKI